MQTYNYFKYYDKVSDYNFICKVALNQLLLNLNKIEPTLL